MSTMFRLLDEFYTLNSRNFRYVAGRWWILTDGYWTTYDARPRMARSLITLASEIWPEGHSAQRQVTKDYMITRLCAGLVPQFRSDRLPGRPEEPTDPHLSQ